MKFYKTAAFFILSNIANAVEASGHFFFPNASVILKKRKDDIFEKSNTVSLRSRIIGHCVSSLILTNRRH